VEEQNDSLILKKERNIGVYTARSGYYVQVDKSGKTQGSR
jgi:hypothetical protein